ncbi:MAG: hypothetical protein HQM09_17680, partial [Candidatus Riflebacteria bacterium]|nr:hypothetical protein [Candidatus Riflebacteria bacterium]
MAQINHKYVHLIGRTYHYQQRVPLDLAEYFAMVGIGSFLRVSLKTDSKDAAISVAIQLAYVVDRLFEALRLCKPEQTRQYIEATRNPFLVRMLQMGVRRIAKADVAEQEQQSTLQQGIQQQVKSPQAGSNPRPQIQEAISDPGEPLQKIIDMFVKMKCAIGGGWGEKCQLDRVACLDVFAEIMSHL